MHQAPWPTHGELEESASGGDELVLETVSDVLGAVRRAKTTAKRSMRAGVALLTVTDRADRLDALSLATDDLRDAGGVGELITVIGTEAAVDVVLESESSV